jgi:hypothetical protein
MIIIKFQKISVTDGKLKEYGAMFDSLDEARKFHGELIDDDNVKAIELQRTPDKE